MLPIVTWEPKSLGRRAQLDALRLSKALLARSTLPPDRVYRPRSWIRDRLRGVATRHFPYRLGRRSAPVLRLFGVRGPQDAFVDMTDDAIVARFGWSNARVPLAGIVSWRIEGPWRWLGAIGFRRSVRHGDITFGGSHQGGVRLDVREPIRIGPFRAPALYLTVEDLNGLAAALATLGIPGEDARTRRD